ncbi:MAG: hypothetical protein ACHQUB_03410 [Candidatus Saccharimonadia bacterium]
MPAEEKNESSAHQELGSGAEAYTELAGGSAEAANRAGIDLIVGNASAAGIEGMADILRDVADDAKLRTAEVALGLVKWLAKDEIPRGDIMTVISGKPGEPTYDAVANNVYKLVGATRPDVATVSPVRNEGSSSELWKSATQIPGIGIVEIHRVSPSYDAEKSYYINLFATAREAE